MLPCIAPRPGDAIASSASSYPPAEPEDPAPPPLPLPLAASAQGTTTHTCKPCLRTGVNDVSKLYTLAGEGT